MSNYTESVHRILTFIDDYWETYDRRPAYLGVSHRAYRELREYCREERIFAGSVSLDLSKESITGCEFRGVVIMPHSRFKEPVALTLFKELRIEPKG